VESNEGMREDLGGEKREKRERKGMGSYMQLMVE